jgi:hypothetical protein
MNKPVNGAEQRKEPVYPYYDLEASIKFSSIIKDLGGSKGGVKKSLIAKQVGLAESTPSFFQRLSAAKTFGIIEGWGEYRLTETGRNYFYPQSEKAKTDALLALFVRSRAFGYLVSRFDGEPLPSTDIMGNVLHQELEVPDSWKDRVAQIFVRSAHFAGIIDSGGFLRYDAEMHKGQPDSPPQAETPAGEVLAQINCPKQLIHNVWQFNGIRLETPEKLSKELWEKLNAFVQILQPPKDDQFTK